MQAPATNTVKDYKWFIIGGLLLGAGLILYFYFSGKAAGKRAGAVNLSNPVNDNGSGTTPGTGAFASEEDVRTLSGKLKDDMTGFNIWGHDNTPYEDLLAMSDTDFIRVNNEFNTDYQASSGQTFRDWLTSENSSIQLGSKWPALRDTIIQRMDKLKII